jgi:heme/copper-type cytochrome/quinol oxidase subunit 3
MSTVARGRRAIPNGVWGVLLFAATEGALFGTLLATYFYLRFRSAQWPPAGIEAPSVALPLALTGALVLTAAPMALAALAARRGRAAAAWGRLGAGCCRWLAFTCLIIHEMIEMAIKAIRMTSRKSNASTGCTADIEVMVVDVAFDRF